MTSMRTTQKTTTKILMMMTNEKTYSYYYYNHNYYKTAGDNMYIQYNGLRVVDIIYQYRTVGWGLLYSIDQ